MLKSSPNSLATLLTEGSNTMRTAEATGSRVTGASTPVIGGDVPDPTVE